MKLTKANVIHFLGLAATVVLGYIVDGLAHSHYVWAPIAIGLLVNLRTALTGTPKPSPAASLDQPPPK